MENEKKTADIDNRFSRIKELARLLPDGDEALGNEDTIIDLVMKPTVRVDYDRYDELIRKELMLESIVRFVKIEKYLSSSLHEFIQAICGEYAAFEKENDE